VPYSLDSGPVDIWSKSNSHACVRGSGSPLKPHTAIINVQRFRGGLVFKAHRLCVSLNSRLESDKEEERRHTTIVAQRLTRPDALLETRAHLRGVSLRARLSGVYDGPIIVPVMARVRQNGESSLINSVISNQERPWKSCGGCRKSTYGSERERRERDNRLRATPEGGKNTSST